MMVDYQKKEEDILVGLVKPQGKRILEVGCGEGRASFMLAKYAEHYVAIDNDGNQINKANLRIPLELKNKIEFKVASATNIPLSGQSVDAVFMLLSFHEVSIQEQGAALVESLRVLKSGGRIVIVDPEAYPVDSIMAICSAVHSKLKYFDHSVIVNHSKKVIEKVTREFDLKLNKEKYDVNWQFDDFNDLKNSVIADFPEIEWNDNKKIILADIIRGVVKDKEFLRPITIPDHMEVTVISK